MRATITERGWGGHFIGVRDCLFRRNTLVTRGDVRVVVSTVGGYLPRGEKQIDTIGAGGRYYETMAFYAHADAGYWEADVYRQVDFDADWSICADSVDDLPADVDNHADRMHERVVGEIVKKIKAGDL